MKIGMICHPTIGGSGVVATELGHQLAARGHEVHFLAYERPFRLQDHPNIHFHLVPVSDYSLFKYPDYALPLAVQIAELPLDILHVHYAIPHAISAYLARQMSAHKPRIVTTLHGTDITLIGREPPFFQLVEFGLEQSDAITAVSQSLADQTRATFHLSKPLHTIPNFVLPPSQPHMRSGLLVHSSNFRPVKRPQDLLAIFRLIRKQLPIRLALIGDIDLPPDPDILCLGPLTDPSPILAQADLFLLPSEQESFGLAALEAMAYGVPVIATQAGGLPEVVGPAGVLHPVGDVEGMAASALDLLTHSNKYATLSALAAERAATLFAPSQVVPQYEALYHNLRTGAEEAPKRDGRGGSSAG